MLDQMQGDTVNARCRTEVMLLRYVSIVKFCAYDKWLELGFDSHLFGIKLHLTMKFKCLTEMGLNVEDFDVNCFIARAVVNGSSLNTHTSETSRHTSQS